MFEPTGRTQQLVERIKGLSADKRRQMFAKLHEMGIDVAKLPIVPSHPGEPAPLSYAQQRQWFLWQLEPHSSAYHIPSALLLRGVVNVEHLRQSFATLAERHACLRTHASSKQTAKSASRWRRQRRWLSSKPSCTLKARSARH